MDFISYSSSHNYFEEDDRPCTKGMSSPEVTLLDDPENNKEEMAIELQGLRPINQAMEVEEKPKKNETKLEIKDENETKEKGQKKCRSFRRWKLQYLTDDIESCVLNVQGSKDGMTLSDMCRYILCNPKTKSLVVYLYQQRISKVFFQFPYLNLEAFEEFKEAKGCGVERTVKEAGPDYYILYVDSILYDDGYDEREKENQLHVFLPPSQKKQKVNEKAKEDSCMSEKPKETDVAQQLRRGSPDSLAPNANKEVSETLAERIERRLMLGELPQQKQRENQQAHEDFCVEITSEKPKEMRMASQISLNSQDCLAPKKEVGVLEGQKSKKEDMLMPPPRLPLRWHQQQQDQQPQKNNPCHGIKLETPKKMSVGGQESVNSQGSLVSKTQEGATEIQVFKKEEKSLQQLEQAEDYFQEIMYEKPEEMASIQGGSFLPKKNGEILEIQKSKREAEADTRVEISKKESKPMERESLYKSLKVRDNNTQEDSSVDLFGRVWRGIKLNEIRNEILERGDKRLALAFVEHYDRLKAIQLHNDEILEKRQQSFLTGQENKAQKYLKTEKGGVERFSNEDEVEERRSNLSQKEAESSRMERDLLENFCAYYRHQEFFDKKVRPLPLFKKELEAFERTLSPEQKKEVEKAMDNGFNPVYYIYKWKTKEKNLKDIMLARDRKGVKNRHVLGLVYDYIINKLYK